MSPCWFANPCMHQIVPLALGTCCTPPSYSSFSSNQDVSISLSPNYLIVGVATQCCVYIYQRKDGSWYLEQILTDVDVHSLFGFSVAIDRSNEDYLIVGAPGSNKTYIYQKTTSWFEVLLSDKSTDPEVKDYGYSVSIDRGLWVASAPESRSQNKKSFIGFGSNETGIFQYAPDDDDFLGSVVRASYGRIFVSHNSDHQILWDNFDTTGHQSLPENILAETFLRQGFMLETAENPCKWVCDEIKFDVSNYEGSNSDFHIVVRNTRGQLGYFDDPLEKVPVRIFDNKNHYPLCDVGVYSQWVIGASQDCKNVYVWNIDETMPVQTIKTDCAQRVAISQSNEEDDCDIIAAVVDRDGTVRIYTIKNPCPPVIASADISASVSPSPFDLSLGTSDGTALSDCLNSMGSILWVILLSEILKFGLLLFLLYREIQRYAA